MKEVTLIVPPIFETQLTGWIMGFKDLYRGKLYRCDIYRYAPQVRCQKEGRPITWEKLPHRLRKTVHTYCESQKKESA